MGLFREYLLTFLQNAWFYHFNNLPISGGKVSYYYLLETCVCVYACTAELSEKLSYIGNRTFHGIINDMFIQMNIGNNAYMLLKKYWEERKPTSPDFIVEIQIGNYMRLSLEAVLISREFLMQ